MTENEMTVLLMQVRNTIERLGDAPAVVGRQSAYTDHGVFYTTFVAGYATPGYQHPALETWGDLTAQADRVRAKHLGQWPAPLRKLQSRGFEPSRRGDRS